MNFSKNTSNNIAKRPGTSFLTIISLVISIASIISTSANAQKHSDVKGTWKMSVETSVGNGSPVFDLKHATDSTLTGTYRGQLGEAPVKGTVTIKTIHLEFSVSGNLVEYDGTVDHDTMKGSVKLGNMGSGTFTGNRKK
jgi:hypothetical protein